MANQEVIKNAARVLVLVATIPARLMSCERLLAELGQQSRKLDGVLLVLDGYGEKPAPRCSLPIIKEYRTSKPSGPGARWRVTADCAPEDILINIDDDAVLREAPGFIMALVQAVESGSGAAAAMGFGADGKRSPPGNRSRGKLIYAAGCGLAAKVGLLEGLKEFAAEVRDKGGPDALGPLGDDDALVSALLWKKGIYIAHAATGVVFAAPNTQGSSQTRARAQKDEGFGTQKEAIRKITGWPWSGTTVQKGKF